MADGDVTRLLHEVFGGEDPRASSWDGALYPGAVVGRFELVREIGRGGFGSVWEARDRELKRRVALKAVERSGRRTLDERAAAEAEVTAHLTHPHIVTLFDVGRTENGPYLVMELLEGRSLGDLLRDGPLPPEEAVRIAAQAARGLAHAHGRGVVHGDLTPPNVFVLPDGSVKLLDLGLARVLATGQVAEGRSGTPGFVPPERLRGEPEDARGDLYALGAVLHRALTGRALDPAARGGAATLAMPGPEPLRELVARLLADDPARRPASAEEVAAALEVLTPEGAEAAAREARGRRRTRQVLGFLGLAVAAGLVALAAWSAREERTRLGVGVQGQGLVVRIERSVLEVGASSSTTAARLADGRAGEPVQPATWWSSDTRVAVVDPAGRVTARGPGTAVVEAFLAGASGNDSVAVPAPGWELVSSSTLAPPPAGSVVARTSTARDPVEELLPTVTWAFGRLAWVGTGDERLSVPLDLPEEVDVFAVEVDLRAPFEPGTSLEVRVAPFVRAGELRALAMVKLQPADRWQTIRVEGSRGRCRARVLVDGVDAGEDTGLCNRPGPHVSLFANSAGKGDPPAAWSNLRVFRGAPVRELHLAVTRLPAGAGAYARGVVTATDDRGNPLVGRTVRWESSDPAVATVDGEGVVTAHRRGRVTLTARCEGKVATARLEIAPGSGERPR